jgi:hypothetical protein
VFNSQHALVQIFLSEYNSFLSRQKEYNINIHILTDKLTLNLMKTGYASDIPDKIDYIVFFINDKPMVEINGALFDYHEKVLETYIKDYIKKQIIMKSDQKELYMAADMLGLGLNDIMNKELINERYKSSVKELHPDRWVNENNPVLTKNAAEAVIELTKARDVLLDNLKGSVL